MTTIVRTGDRPHKDRHDKIAEGTLFVRRDGAVGAQPSMA
jgi:hypothetical protein